MEAGAFLEQGARILATRLEPLGYRFEIVQQPTQGSGGTFAIGAFRRGDREIRLWVRFNNLSVNYRVGEIEFAHGDYMRTLGLEKVAHFPGFNDGDPLGGFRRLLHDLQQCDDFLIGDANSLAQRIRALPPKKTGFQALGS
jgi:hypothetical protein